ncbi:MAG: hypothetical protein ABJN84_02045 [Flavobacteriaceae bacterium]
MKDSNLPDYYESIFHQLLEHTTDMECKFLLLDQVLEVGDKKEIPMLNRLIMNKIEPTLKKKALKIKSDLLNKLQALPAQEDEKLPASLCFLYDEFDIRPPKEKMDAEIDFEISLEILAHK